MKILIYDMGSYTYKNIIEAFERKGCQCDTLFYRFPDKYNDDFFCSYLEKKFKIDSYDFVFSVNFFPLVAKVCYNFNILYLSWSYDSPLEDRLRDFFSYKTNIICLFDREDVKEYRKLGYNNVFHLPLATTIKSIKASETIRKKFQSDISFVGKVYDSPLDILLSNSNDYIKGYIEGIIQSQLRIYGAYFVDEMISDDLLNQLNQEYEKLGQKEIFLNKKGLSYAIASKITQLERQFILELLAEFNDVRLYSYKKEDIPFVKNYGMVKYYNEMPYVFYYSKLNLNPTLKSIRSGIPLRALDICSAGGTLISNYQPELLEYFEDEKDMICYSSMEEAFEKVTFYLEHDDLRRKIACNGYEKIRIAFNYSDRIDEMMKLVKDC